MQADGTTLDAKKAGTVELPDDVFGLEPRPDILHRMVRYQLAKRRGGTRSVQDRSEVNYTTAKLYKQKGTGRARHGSRMSAKTPATCRVSGSRTISLSARTCSKPSGKPRTCWWWCPAMPSVPRLRR